MRRDPHTFYRPQEREEEWHRAKSRYKAKSKNNPITNLRILSINIQGIHNNIAFLRAICKEYDLILLQEHWLPQCNSQDIKELLNGWNCQTICKDDNSNDIDFSKKPSPGGGIATLWQEHLSPHINMNKSSAHPRVLITTLEFPAYPLCVLNCYLPSGNSKEATEKFMEDIDTIDSLINRYKATHEVIIMGDLNEDHFQRKGKKEKAVRQLIQNHKLNDRGKSIGS